ncbi:hypothetical protein ACJEM9_24190, partial [Escherichia coli]
MTWYTLLQSGPAVQEIGQRHGVVISYSTGIPIMHKASKLAKLKNWASRYFRERNREGRSTTTKRSETGERPLADVADMLGHGG